MKLTLLMLRECYRKFEYMYIHILVFDVFNVTALVLFMAGEIAVHLENTFDEYGENRQLN
ncbi:hypothetical protein [Zhongshania aliphaticivorans]|uniref:hypothetical protein n=1 Tax=Zhongshania aliphaticivorans TaxID=1470434 RepID=UPI0012E4197E|nr:hypothetical protein [Zhongshania aliphaticivorans]CAA0120539.1 Uncharacterised protein [Zhongshania aliphaticivorans]